MASTNIKYEEEFITNNEGVKLFTCKWIPEGTEPKALVFLCHGYAMESSISMKGTAHRLVKGGYGVYGIDYIGHGRSEGLHGYIPSFDRLVQDCSDHFTSVAEKEQNRGKQRFLMGESMGGAVVLLLHRKKPEFWDGAILVAPMCKIAEDLRPSAIVTSFLTKLCKVIPTWKIVPTQDIIEAAVRDPESKKQVRANPYWYTGRPRLKTANELLNVTIDIENRLKEVSLPFIIIHGGDDKVTDPAISKLLYESASSTDKTFKLYDGMWHALTYGEFPENVDIVFKDVIGWLDERAMRGNERLEKEKKLSEDRDASSGKVESSDR